MARIAIFDYGAGNLFSLKSSLERNGSESVEIIYDLNDLDRFDGLVLPGVGNFDPAIRSIEGGAKELGKAIDSGMPVMGICLGMEMLFNRSEEGKLDGLKILDGDVVMLPKSKVKIPHMGWNNLRIKRKSRILKGVPDGSWVYFVHSYRAAPKARKMVVATADYGVSVPAVIEKENLIGVQFHPEKSGDIGAVMIKNFIAICDNGSDAR
ncbi:MAG TPA: imidazole glycerol phosphate synthase subunit HisH [Nitrososphaera sp.]|nr:imidazole glycerol phosphate synthase subunit HisH [Nitrososphaera sp.]